MFSNEVGAAIHCAPNATRILSWLGFDFEKAKAVKNVRVPCLQHVFEHRKKERPDRLCVGVSGRRRDHRGPWRHELDAH